MLNSSIVHTMPTGSILETPELGTPLYNIKDKIFGSQWCPLLKGSTVYKSCMFVSSFEVRHWTWEWGIYGLNGWEIYGLNEWVSYDKLSYTNMAGVFPFFSKVMSHK